MKDQHNVVPFQPKVVPSEPEPFSLSFQLIVHGPTAKHGQVLKDALDTFVGSVFEKGIMVDYRCVDWLGRDLVPVEEPKQY